MRAIIVDLDDTVARKTDRHPYDWARLDEDLPISQNIEIIKQIQSIYDCEIIILTARNEGYHNKNCGYENYLTIGREKSEAWVKKYIGYVDRVLMKPTGSYENSAVFKANEIQKLMDEGVEILMVIDDNSAVIKKIQEEFEITTLFLR